MNPPFRIPEKNPLDQFAVEPGETLLKAALRLGIFDQRGELTKANRSIKGITTEQRPLAVTDCPEKITPELLRLIGNMERLNYKIFRDATKNYNLNLVGVRSSTSEPNLFDDVMWVFWKWDDVWHQRKYTITTDPGLTYLNAPANQSGTAILKPGQYRGAYKLGKHKGVYEALVQANEVTVIRDFNRDNKLDFHSGKEQTGFFGINIHRARSDGESRFVNKWSAGCQVFANAREYDDFMKLCRLSLSERGNSFTYTLLEADKLSP